MPKRLLLINKKKRKYKNKCREETLHLSQLGLDVGSELIQADLIRGRVIGQSLYLGQPFAYFRESVGGDGNQHVGRRQRRDYAEVSYGEVFSGDVGAPFQQGFKGIVG